MKTVLVISCCLSMLTIAACGGEDKPAAQEPTVATKQAKAGPVTEVPGTAGPPPLDVPSGPPPQKVIFRDVKKGSGVEIQPQRKFITNYIALDYATGDRVEDYWDGESFQWCWRTGGLTNGWEIGLAGMRVGGQRELIVPSKDAYGSGARVYVVELLSVE